MSAETPEHTVSRFWTRLRGYFSRGQGETNARSGPAKAFDVPLGCVEWRQGDVFAIDSLTVVDGGGRPVEHRCDLGVAVVSQSCDASQPSRPLIQLAPVTRLETTSAREARDGKRPRYAHLAAVGPDLFADLDVIATAHKARLASANRTAGVSDDVAVRRFSGAVARRFGRYAFPDPVVACLQPLRDALASKAPKPATPLGSVLGMVSALRIEVADGWTNTPHDLTLIVVLEPGALPTGGPDGDDLPDLPPGLEEQLRDSSSKLQPSLIAQRLTKADATPDFRYWLWQFLAQAWAEQCEAEAARHNLRETVRSVRHELVTADEFSLSRVNRSEALDLDYLSEPLPRSAGDA
ncbi:hypothetical protein [Cellulomonas sp. PS-H5]|uniref:hypothetical protein n=1 Tax=Cellulomonas sp. PS-H5 TaxID=2820400 RepID=UPI001C4F3F4F|nr:hypothetical protein [Cellulomonas sp. PS-H5]MBW0255866.1 hypothetical protein [Cellulomonas sp. PS-H5]